jgi:hypothetical protein
MLRQESDYRHHEAGRAEAALKAVTFVKRLLHGMQRCAIGGETFDGRHLVTLSLHGEHEAGTHGRAVE